MVNAGTLTDTEIEALALSGSLISSAFEQKNIKQACYEIRASTTYYDALPAGAALPKTVQIGDANGILIKPRQMVVLISEEAFDLPSDMLGRILSKGQLFSLGLVPVNTYADPGFSGRLGLVFVNSSSNYLRILPGDAIAKIEFVRLAMPVAKPYSGQHGYGMGVWPLRAQNILTPAEIKQDARIGRPADELRAAYGNDFGDLVDRVFVHGRRFAFGMIAYLTVSLLLLLVAVDQSDRLSTVVSIVAGVLTNAFTGAVVYFASNIRRRR